MEALLSETEMLQGKLHSQEEDFRLQNSTLMTELSKVDSYSPSSSLSSSTCCNLVFSFQLCTQIEQLEQENQGLKEAGGGESSSTSSPASCPTDGEVVRLQAENATLQKKMKGGSFYLQQMDKLTSDQPQQDTSMSALVGLCDGLQT